MAPPPSLEFDPSKCTLETCDLSYATVSYDPSLGGNAFYLAVFAMFLLYHTVQGIRYRTWGFLFGMFGGLLLEVIGYIARVQMHFNPWLSNPFLTYIVCLTIAPVFMAGAVYICFTRIVQTYGTEHARFSPATYTKLFIGSDIISLVLQAVGGAIADTADTHSSAWVGIRIMIAGLSFQVVSLTIYFVLCTDFAWRVRKAGAKPQGLAVPDRKFYAFLWMLFIAAVAIFIRSVYRVAELAGGFDGKLANEEVPYMILEGAMIVIAAIALSIFHPGHIFQGVWKDLGAVNNCFGRKKKAQPEAEKNGTETP